MHSACQESFREMDINLFFVPPLNSSVFFSYFRLRRDMPRWHVVRVRSVLPYQCEELQYLPSSEHSVKDAERGPYVCRLPVVEFMAVAATID